MSSSSSGDRPTTARGARIFAQQERRDLRVVESSLATCGPHAWPFADDGRQSGQREVMLQLSVEDARLVIDGLERFVEEAEAGQLAEPAAEKKA